MLGYKVDSGIHKLWEQVGYLEEATYYPGLTVLENLDIARRMQMISDCQSIARVIKKLGLAAHKNKKAKNLSLGNKQRLGLAKAMIHNPKILILDEPINGLDPAGVVEIREMLMDLSKNFGVTVFISSHQLEELCIAGGYLYCEYNQGVNYAFIIHTTSHLYRKSPLAILLKKKDY